MSTVHQDGEAAVHDDLECPARGERGEAHGSHSVTQSNGKISLFGGMLLCLGSCEALKVPQQ